MSLPRHRHRDGLCSERGLRLLLPAAVLACLLAAGCAAETPRPEAAPQAPPEDRAVGTAQADRSGVEIEPTVVAGDRAANAGQPEAAGNPEYKDPLIGFNRAVFSFNDFVYRYTLIPAGKAYVWALPTPVRGSIDNVFHNIKTPIYLLNHLFQGRPALAGRDLARFAVNSTAGVLGLFDPAASKLNIAREETRSDDTLQRYGTGYGFYLVIPILGPSTARGGVATVFDYLMNPIPYVLDRPESTLVTSFDYFQRFAAGAERYETLRDKAEDPYIFFRNLHLQGLLRDQAYGEQGEAPADE